MIRRLVLLAVAMASLPVVALESPSFAEFDAKAKSGAVRLNVVFFGGSFTWGAGASDPQRTSWRGLMMRHLLERYPRGNFSFHDATVGGTGSQLGIFRVDRDVLAYKPDLVFLDFCANDGAWCAESSTLCTYEHLLRVLIGAKACVMHTFFGGKSMFGENYAPEKNFARRTFVKRLSVAYSVPEGDLLPLLQGDWKEGKVDLDKLWTPHDSCHPNDAGYQYFFECARIGFWKAVAEKTVCRVPNDPVFGDVRDVRRIRLVDGPLPDGWGRDYAQRNAAWFDGLSSRWMGDVARFTGTNAVPLVRRAKGQLVAFFGEGNPNGLDFEVYVDGRKVATHATGIGFGSLFVYRSTLDDDWVSDLREVERTVAICPIANPSNDKAELRLESLCTAVLVPVAVPKDGQAPDRAKTLEEIDHSRAD